jgi:general secretion pathway protein G
MTNTPAKRPWCDSDAGFTLVELLVVLVILGLLAAVATPQALKYLGRSKTNAAQIQVRGLVTSLDLFRLDIGRYPSQNEGLVALVERPTALENWHGPYVTKREMLQDPWGRTYLYRIPGQHGEFDLFTYGSDRAAGGDGEGRDVTSW